MVITYIRHILNIPIYRIFEKDIEYMNIILVFALAHITRMVDPIIICVETLGETLYSLYRKSLLN